MTWRFIRDEEGQATTEYMMLLAVAVSLAMIVFKVLKPAMAKLTDGIAGKLENMIFKPGSMHRFRITK